MSFPEKNIPIDKQIFVERLQQRLDEMDISRTKLAKLSGVTTSAISAYMYSARMPRAAELSRLAAALGVSMDWLWGIDAATSSHDELRAQVVYLNAQLTHMARTLRGLATEAENNKVSLGTQRINCSGNGKIYGGITNNTCITISPPFQNPQDTNNK